MARSVVIMVVDNNGRGLSGHKVNAYNRDKCYTDRDGQVTLQLETSNTTIYVNGLTAYDGTVSRMDNVMSFDTCGRKYQP